LFTAASSSASLPDECKPVQQNGPKDSSIDIVFVMGDYSSDKKAYDHVEFYAGLEGTDRGLFDVYPMNVSQDRFNLWYVKARQGSSTTEGDKGPLREARYQRKQCSADYAVYLAKDSHSWTTGALDRVSRVKGIEQKISKDSGAIGLIHEWGHMLGGLADEYDFQYGKKSSTQPNCAATMSQARDWWGDMARESSNVGYEKGCKNSKDMIEPHPGGTIMGDGGLRNYGPVNDREMLRQIQKETKPITDISLENPRAEGNKIKVLLEFSKASNVVKTEISDGNAHETTFVHGSGTKTVALDRPSGKNRVILKADTVNRVQEKDSLNNYATVDDLNEENNSDTGKKNSTDNLQSELEETRSKLQDAQKRVSELESELETARTRLTQTENQVSELAQEKNRLEEQVSNLSSQNAVLKSRIENESSDNTTSAEQSNNRIQKLQTKNQELESRVNALRESLNQTSQELLETESRVEDLRSENTQYRQTIEDLRQQREENKPRPRSGSGSQTSDGSSGPSEGSGQQNREEKSQGIVDVLTSIF
jgi:uncharacterized coiled-coil DUF342 family protein